MPVSLGWPTYLEAPITSEYGWRLHPLYGYPKWHNGLDIGTPEGSPIYASSSGVVKTLNPDPSASSGLYIILDHKNGMSSSYSHLSDFLVRVGQEVRQGELIGLSGSTGGATGPHLHWRVNDPSRSLREGGDVNPLDYLKGNFALRSGGTVSGAIPKYGIGTLILVIGGYVIYRKAKSKRWI